MVLLGKIMILHGVGHPISCLGVCYANDPQKGGYTTPAPALDLTTSLRGDFHLLRTAPWDHQPPPATNRQPPSTNRRQPPSANNQPRPPTATRHQPPTANHQPPPTANRQQPTPTTNRHAPTATNHELSTAIHRQRTGRRMCRGRAVSECGVPRLHVVPTCVCRGYTVVVVVHVVHSDRAPD